MKPTRCRESLAEQGSEHAGLGGIPSRIARHHSPSAADRPQPYISRWRPRYLWGRPQRRAIAISFALVILGLAGNSHAESKQEYENRFLVMLDYAVRLNDFVRSHLGDRKLAAYAQTMSERNADEAEKMTPPETYRMLHPHFLLVLENIERSFYAVAKGDLSRYREHQRRVQKELRLLEALAEKANLDPYIFGRRY